MAEELFGLRKEHTEQHRYVNSDYTSLSEVFLLLRARSLRVGILRKHGDSVIKLSIQPEHVNYIDVLIANEVIRLDSGVKYPVDDFCRFLVLERKSIIVGASMDEFLTFSRYGEIQWSESYAPPFPTLTAPDEHSTLMLFGRFILKNPKLNDLMPKKPTDSVLCLWCKGSGYPDRPDFPDMRIKYPNLLCGFCAGGGYLPPPKKDASGRTVVWKPERPWKITLSDYGLSAPDDDPTP
jgi:hypothetical protein